MIKKNTKAAMALETVIGIVLVVVALLVFIKFYEVIKNAIISLPG